MKHIHTYLLNDNFCHIDHKKYSVALSSAKFKSNLYVRVLRASIKSQRTSNPNSKSNKGISSHNWGINRNQIMIPYVYEIYT